MADCETQAAYVLCDVLNVIECFLCNDPAIVQLYSFCLYNVVSKHFVIGKLNSYLIFFFKSSQFYL